MPYDPAIPLLGIHTEETRIERDTCTLMFIAALFIIARTWKQPSCPSAVEWVRKLWYIYTMEYSVQFSSVAQLYLTLCNPMNCSMPGLPVHHQLPEFTQTHVHRVSDAISSSVIPFSSCPQSLPASESFRNYSALKKNAFESVLMRWMKLEPIIQSEVSQKEKHQYSILTHIYGI